jgi:iron complex outermembrane receptor protein
MPVLYSALPSFLLILTALSTGAQEKKRESSSQEPVNLEPVVVTASPLGRTLFEQAQPVSILDGDKLTLSLEPTLGETLSKTPGVRSSYFGPAASRPVIRGLDADRIRVLQNGLNTMDASATSVDHAVSFDPVSAESIEVVRGPATLLYGSNAIGGVVNVVDNRIPGERIAEAVRGSAGARYTSAADGLSGDVLLEGGVGGFAWHLEGYKRDFDDLHIPGFARSARLRALVPLAPGEVEEYGRLGNSYMETDGFSAGGSYIWDRGYFGLAYSGFNAGYGSPAEKEVSIDMDQRRWDFQGVFREPLTGIKTIQYRFGLSDYRHTEFEGAEPGTTFSNEGHDGRVEITHEKIGALEGAFGYQTERSDFSALGDEKFLPPALTKSHSGFVFEEFSFTDTAKLQGGLRYDHITVDADADPDFGPSRSRNFDNLSGSLGLVFTPSDDYAVALSSAYSGRAPTYQELYANGPHIATGVFEVGDDSLPVERSLGFDLSLRKRTGRVTGSLTAFYNRFDHFVGQFPTGGVEDDLPVTAYRSTDARFYGGEAEVIVHLLEPVTEPAEVVATGKAVSGKQPAAEAPVPSGSSLDLELRADYVHAEDTRTGDPLPRISPFHASVALDYHRGAFGARLEGIYAAEQDRTASNELPTDSYFMVNAALSYTLHAGRTTTGLFIKGVNLTDEEAREHTSFLKDIAPLGGRGVVAGVKISF